MYRSSSNEINEWKIIGIRDIYNRLIGSSELTKIQYHLSSNVLTFNILKHPEEEINLNNKILDRSSESEIHVYL